MVPRPWKKPLAARALLALALLAPAAPVAARDQATPDWPCVQRKIDHITSTQVWPGPPVDDLAGWRSDRAIAALVARLADRRMPLPQAETLVADFAAAEPLSTRAERLTLVFAGVFASLDDQRRSMIARLESYRRAQGERARELERQGVAMAALEQQAVTDAGAAEQLRDAQAKFLWAQRIFQERQNSIPLACELPVRIDQRAFALGKTIHELIAATVTEPAAADAPAPATK